MRYSVLAHDPGYPAYMALPAERRWGIRIALDGRPMAHCLTVDDELGIVVVTARDSRGRLLVTEDGEYLDQTFSGNVEITEE